jgi:hypothetical protein
VATGESRYREHTVARLASKKAKMARSSEAVGLTFAVKTYAASLLSLYVAFWAGLDDPQWAFLTVYIVSQPDSGLVLAKGFYRILGTIAGVLVVIALVFGLAQYGELRGRACHGYVSATLPLERCAISRPTASSSLATR